MLLAYWKFLLSEFFFKLVGSEKGKDLTWTFATNWVLYCHHFDHFSFAGIKLRKL